MKKDALIKGADVAPISLTAGMWSGRGVVSIMTSVLNLLEALGEGFFQLAGRLGRTSPRGSP